MAAVDPFRNSSPQLSDPARFAQVITPADGVALTAVARAIWVGTSGNLRITTVGGNDVTIPNASGLIPISATMIQATGTTASGIVIFY